MSDLSSEEIETIKSLLGNFYNNNDSSVVPELFRLIDRDGSGSLEADEIEPVIVSISGKRPQAGQVEEIIRAADQDGNSTIELNEFEALLNNESIKALIF